MEFIKEPNRIWQKDENGKMIAEITFPETADGICTIDHTYVAKEYGGRGIAAQLVEEAVSEIRSQGKTVEATCSYAAAWLLKHGKDN